MIYQQRIYKTVMNLVWEFLIACQLIADAVHYCGIMNSKWFKGSEYENEASVHWIRYVLSCFSAVFGFPLGPKFMHGKQLVSR